MSQRVVAQIARIPHRPVCRIKCTCPNIVLFHSGDQVGPTGESRRNLPLRCPQARCPATTFASAEFPGPTRIPWLQSPVLSTPGGKSLAVSKFASFA